MLCYSNNGASMRAVDADYVAQDGEVLFPDDASDADLAQAFSGYAPAAPRSPTVLKSTVIARLTADQMAAAWKMFNANPVLLAKWFAPDKPSINCDDAGAIAFVKALKLDPAVILAP